MLTIIAALVIRIMTLILPNNLPPCPSTMKVYVDGKLIQTMEVNKTEYISDILRNKKEEEKEYLDCDKDNQSYRIVNRTYGDKDRLIEERLYYVLNPGTNQEEKFEYIKNYKYDDMKLLSIKTEYENYTQEVIFEY